MKHQRDTNLHKLLKSVEPPRAPKDLQDRIVQEIPDTFSRERSPVSPFRWTREAWSIAAILILVVGASYITLRYMETPGTFDQPPAASLETSAQAPPSLQGSQQSGSPTELSENRTEVARKVSATPDDAFAKEMVPGEAGSAALPPGEPVATAEAPLADAAPVSRREISAPSAEQRESERDERSTSSVAKAADRDSMAAAPPVPRPASARPSPEAGPPVVASRGEAEAAQESSPGRSRDTIAGPGLVAAFAVSGESYSKVRKDILGGALPAPADVRIEEIVNHFDYADSASRGSDFSAVIQGGPAPFASGSRDFIVRFGLLAPSNAPGGVVATDFLAEIAFDSRKVGRIRIVGSGDVPVNGSYTMSAETVYSGQTMTVLGEIRLASEIDRDALLGKVRLRYRRSGEANFVEVSHPILLESFSRNWRTAPDALKLASLVAAWSEFLSRTHPGGRLDLHELESRADSVAGKDLDRMQIQDFRRLVSETIRLSGGDH